MSLTWDVILMKSVFELIVDYEAVAGRNYLVLTKEQFRREELIAFQVEMIINNNITGVVPLELREKNNNLKLYYHLSGLTSLANYFKRQKVSKQEFAAYLNQIAGIISASSNYLLNDNGFILDEEYIFIKPTSKEVFLVYLPIEVKSDVNSSFKEFVTKLLTNTATIATQDNYVQLLLGLLRGEEFKLTDFQNELQSLVRAEGNELTEKKFSSLPQAIITDAKSVSAKLEALPLEPSLQKPVSVRPDLEKPMAERLASPRPVETKILTSGTTAVKQITLRTKLLTALAVSLAIMAWVVNRNFTGFKLSAPNGKHILITVGVFLLAGLLLGGTLFVLYRGKTGKRQGKASKGPALKTEAAKSAPEGAFNQRPTPVQEDVAAGFSDIPDETVLLADGADETVMLGKSFCPTLTSLTTNQVIFIDKPVLIIGRNQETCDRVVEDKSVGRAHAEIKLLYGTYYISDLDSRNGTFINGKQLVSNKQYQLRENDKVAFANNEFIFNCD